MATLQCTVDRSNWYSMYIEYSYTQDVANNKSTISHSLKLKQLTDSYDFNGNMDVTYYVNGESFSYNGNVNIDDKGNTGYTITIKSGTTTVTHNADGTKSIAFSCSGICNSGGWGPGNIKLSSTNVTLTTIARASQPSCITYPNNTQNVGDIGSTIYIHMNRASSSFTHTVSYSFGNAKSTISTGVTNNVQWTIPMSLCNEIPNATSGSGTITVDTYNGGTKIGTKTCSFTCTVPSSVIPTVNTLELQIDNSSNSVISGWGIAVAGYTKVNVKSTASGSYGSTIKSFGIVGGYNKTVTGTSLNYTGSAITTSGYKGFDVTATDSRGRVSTQAISSLIQFYAYSKPSVTSFSVSRSQLNARQMVVKANWSYSSINNNNVVNAIVYYKKSTSTNWTKYNGSITKNTNVTLSNVEFDEASSYNFRITITDSLSQSSTDEAFVSTIDVLLDFKAGGRGLGIGKIAENDVMEVALDSVFIGDVYIKVNNVDISLKDYIKGVMNGTYQ